MGLQPFFFQSQILLFHISPHKKIISPYKFFIACLFFGYNKNMDDKDVVHYRQEAEKKGVAGDPFFYADSMVSNSFPVGLNIPSWVTTKSTTPFPVKGRRQLFTSLLSPFLS